MKSNITYNCKLFKVLHVKYVTNGFFQEKNAHEIHFLHKQVQKPLKLAELWLDHALQFHSVRNDLYIKEISSKWFWIRPVSKWVYTAVCSWASNGHDNILHETLTE